MSAVTRDRDVALSSAYLAKPGDESERAPDRYCHRRDARSTNCHNVDYAELGTDTDDTRPECHTQDDKKIQI